MPSSVLLQIGVYRRGRLEGMVESVLLSSVP